MCSRYCVVLAGVLRWYGLFVFSLVLTGPGWPGLL